MSNKEQISDIKDGIESVLQRAGLRVTPQRIAIYRILKESVEHPSVQMVYEMVKKEYPHISFDTVNRTLGTLAEIGEAFVVEGSGDVKRFDGGMSSHQHFKCIKCKRIIDFHYEPFDNIEVPEYIAKNFSVYKRTVYIEGICDKCTGGKKQKSN